MLRSGTKCLQLHRAARAAGAASTGGQTRTLLTLAIETSCDDTSVAILETHERGDPLPKSFSTKAHLHFHKRLTAQNRKQRGIDPAVACEHHQKSLGVLTNEAIQHLPKHAEGTHRRPDFVSVTRGPGLRGCLDVGLNVAKGLAAAWQVPLLAVHHMQAHLLTPRLDSALRTSAISDTDPSSIQEFPFVTLLVSGGHTMVLLSNSLTEHAILSNKTDISIGDYLDKVGRDLVPLEILRKIDSNTLIYGRILSEFAFPLSYIHTDTGRAEHPYQYSPPKTLAEYIERVSPPPYNWSLPVPFSKNPHRPEFSFAGLGSTVAKLIAERTATSQLDFEYAERRELARESLRVAFEHIAMRVGDDAKKIYQATGASSASRPWQSDPNDQPWTDFLPGRFQRPRFPLVISGGVASNPFLRHLLPRFIKSHRFPLGPIVVPPPDLCTDNAAMIAWCGVEMWRAGWRSDLSVRCLKEWSMDSRVEAEPERRKEQAGMETGLVGKGGGVLGAYGWRERDDAAWLEQEPEREREWRREDRERRLREAEDKSLFQWRFEEGAGSVRKALAKAKELVE